MTEKVLDMKERSRDDWGVDDVTLNIGSKPSRATISMPHDGTEPPETPQAIKVVCDENTVFQGTLVSSSEKAVGKLPELIATYADARAKLAKIPTPARRRHSDGETVLTPNEPLVFNRDGEFDRNPSTELRFGGPLDECVCWSFWDVLNYLVEYGFSDSPASELVSFDTSEIDGFCKSRLFTLLARNFDISEKSLADALNSLLSFAGLSWRVEFDAPLPYITVFPLRAFGDGRTFDAGVVRGVVDINEPPDITEFETTAHNTLCPQA
ncbi:MAG: hypothetical protein U5N86_04590 [Planctomycetota bacterium]|nr:hypothetical protein [Planctomycetota bacterium]